MNYLICICQTSVILSKTEPRSVTSTSMICHQSPLEMIGGRSVEACMGYKNNIPGVCYPKTILSGRISSCSTCKLSMLLWHHQGQSDTNGITIEHSPHYMPYVLGHHPPTFRITDSSCRGPSSPSYLLLYQISTRNAIPIYNWKTIWVELVNEMFVFKLSMPLLVKSIYSITQTQGIQFALKCYASCVKAGLWCSIGVLASGETP